MEYEFNYKDLGTFFFKNQAPRDIPTDQLVKLYISSNLEPGGGGGRGGSLYGNLGKGCKYYSAGLIKL
jgi:hypothetical protein